MGLENQDNVDELRGEVSTTTKLSLVCGGCHVAVLEADAESGRITGWNRMTFEGRPLPGWRVYARTFSMVTCPACVEKIYRFLDTLEGASDGN